MNPCSKSRSVLLLMAVTMVVFVLSSATFGQCSMCRAALAGSNNAFFIRNFNIGVLVLLLPPVTIFCSIFVVLRRYKTSDDDRDKEQDTTGASPESD